MRSKQLANEKKFINISFDFNQYQFPATTKNRSNKNQLQTQISQIESTSQRKRVLNRVSHKITPSYNFSTQISQTSKKLTQPTSNFTDKSNSSIEILKEQPINNEFKFQMNRKQHYHTQTNQSKDKEIKNIKIQTELDEIKQNDLEERITEQKVVKCIQYPQFYSIYGRVKKQSSRESQILQKALSNILNESSSPRNQKEIDWNTVKLPLTQKECIQRYGNYLTAYEKIEVQQYNQIYCIGCQAKKQQNQMTQYNDGFDDVRGEYLININDHIGYRFEILQVIGKGSFGQALKVYDHQKQVLCCLKIIRNKTKFYKQAIIELQILNFLKEKDQENLSNIIKIKEYLVFRNHMCLCFELLSMNLYELMRINNFSGLSLELIRRFAIQILNALNFLQQNNIIHCDLKPENILLKCANKSGIKLIDFGSSCFEDQKLYTYIQSRYYRAPEVILGLPYTKSIDMWSFGCVLAELYLGYPIFPGENEQEQISLFLEAIGLADQEMIAGAERRKLFFKDTPPYKPLLYQNKRGKVRLPGTRSIQELLKCDDSMFVDFISKCLVWNPKKRMKPVDALLHIFILEGLPTEIRQQHIDYIEKEFENNQKKRKSIPLADKEKRFQFNFTSEPEMCKNIDNQSKEIKKSIYKSKLLFKGKDIDEDPINIPKKNSFSLHSNKNQKQICYTNYFPETTKSFIMKTNQFN